MDSGGHTQFGMIKMSWKWTVGLTAYIDIVNLLNGTKLYTKNGYIDVIYIFFYRNKKKWGRF